MHIFYNDMFFERVNSWKAIRSTYLWIWWANRRLLYRIVR